MTRLMSDQEARDAIAHDLDATLVVEAAAGTGKTTELVNRILALAGRTSSDQRERNSPTVRVSDGQAISRSRSSWIARSCSRHALRVRADTRRRVPSGSTTAPRQRPVAVSK